MDAREKRVVALEKRILKREDGEEPTIGLRVLKRKVTSEMHHVPTESATLHILSALSPCAFGPLFGD
jgi:hypothetical protein